MQQGSGLTHKILVRSVLGKYLNLRREERLQPQGTPVVTLYHHKLDETSHVQLLDLSQNGMAFATKDQRFQVGDKIQFRIETAQGLQQVFEAEIKSQHIFYPSGPELLKHAIFRFSAQLSREIKRDEFHDVKKCFHIST
jgi:hypothetical protein